MKVSGQCSPVNCCWPSPAQSLSGSGPVRTHDHIFVSSRLLRVFDERRGLTVTGHSPSAGVQLSTRSHSLIQSLSLTPQLYFQGRSPRCLLCVGGWVNPRASLDPVENRKISFSAKNQTPILRPSIL
jgi:hypothetical protein